jgi:hypothetical protein
MQHSELRIWCCRFYSPLDHGKYLKYHWGNGTDRQHHTVFRALCRLPFEKIMVSGLDPTQLYKHYIFWIGWITSKINSFLPKGNQCVVITIIKRLMLYREINATYRNNNNNKLLESYQYYSDNTWATYQESKKLRNYKQLPYRALHARTHTHTHTHTHTAGSDDVKVQNIYRVRNNITSSTNCKYRTAATLCTLQTWFVSRI